ncbi:Ig-like domain-containing protein [Salinibacterium sp. ZJ77]|uniref:Ig-like domain-containing protein n=1 Tax=Salinibacterium sp. ZJ77 TaxID=2708337 RepID=UPI0014222E40|nr:Ig-like domain-containing protein [Salinibacterium sp. ZJ77]
MLGSLGGESVRQQRGRSRVRAIASATVVALVAGTTLTLAALHPGYPISDVELTSRDVWVTNGEQLLGGRLNRQIDELNGSVIASSPNFDVLQDGDTLLIVDPDASTISSVDPASTVVTSSVTIPAGSEVAFGGSVIAIVGPTGSLWGISSAGDLAFDPAAAPPLAELGDGGRAVVTHNGAILAVSREDGLLHRIENLAASPETMSFPRVGAFDLAAVGDIPVVLDRSTNELVWGEGRSAALGSAPAHALQLTSAASPAAYVATGDALLRIDLESGKVSSYDTGTSSAPDAESVAAPAVVDGCAHGAWGHAQRYLLVCDGGDTEAYDIAEPLGRLAFRVNRQVVVLNDLENGNVWLPAENLRLVDNWDDVTPPEDEETEEEGDEKSAQQTFEDTLAERSDANRPPSALDDAFGIRPGRTTILSVLDNDSDPDGDVLVISSTTPIAESTGRLEPIDGGRALQFTPAPGFMGSIRFGYTIDDGRGGSASADVTAAVVSDDHNTPPLELRRSGAAVEAGQTVAYGVLANWRDPDGDDLTVVSATARSSDLVRFAPDGTITFTHLSADLGQKEVVFQVSDGHGAVVTGTLLVDVQAVGTLRPVATPDFVSVFVGEVVVVAPLANDSSPSGGELTLVSVEEPDGDASVALDADRGQVRVVGSEPGVRYLTYTVSAGAQSTTGLIRVDVLESPADESAPIAVTDTVYLRGDEPTTVSVLSNDASPTGRILAVQEAQVPLDVQATGLVVELLQSTLVRVTAPTALTQPVAFSYTVSDGLLSSSASVTVVPIPALVRHQPPIARDDRVTVRAGDIVTVDVLANDTHPDGVRMTVAAELATEPSAGLAFVQGDAVRFQAPTEPGQHRADYTVVDAFGETSGASILFTVTPVDESTNRDPRPTSVIARVLAGNQIRIDLPLQRIDPDGDSVELLRLPSAPTLGTVIEQGPGHLVYQAAPGVAGTDSFTYQVFDTFGATATGDLDIAVIPPPNSLSAPNAVPDSVAIRPGRVAQVDLTANDSDPQGSPIEVSEQLVEVPAGIDVTVVDGRYLLVVAPPTPQAFSVRYELTNDRGGRAVTYVLVEVSEDAPLTPPVARDVVLSLAEIAGEETLDVDVFDGHAFNPGGANEALALTLEGPNASSAELVESAVGTIAVRPAAARHAIAYRLTDPETGLSGTAFVIVPAAVTEEFDAVPTIDPELPVQYVPMNERREWRLSDILVVPSGREAWITDASTVTAIRSNAEPAFVDDRTIAFQGERDYRGPASLTFTVTDGASIDDPKGNTVALTLPIVVGDPEFRDTPPIFTAPVVRVEPGEQVQIDLRDSTAHPNAQILREVTYDGPTGASGAIGASQDGSVLTISTPRSTPKGTTGELGTTLRWGDFTVPGTVQVLVVESTRPRAVAATDEIETRRGEGAVIIAALANDMNPFQATGEQLRIVDAVFDDASSANSVTFTADQVRVTPDPSLKAGVVTVIYTVEDATRDLDRRVSGTISVIVSDVPDRPSAPERDGGSAIGGDGTATIRFQAPATNGKPITSYELMTSPAVLVPASCQAGTACTIDGLVNGTAYQFAVRAVNEHGAGEWSTSSSPITPYGTPAAPAPTVSVSDPWAGPSSPGSARVTWPAVAGTGGQTSYLWSLSDGREGEVAGAAVDLVMPAAGSFEFMVRARNTGGKTGPTSAAVRVDIAAQSVPPAPATPGMNVTNADAGHGSITWTWVPVAGAPEITANLAYEVSLNGGAPVRVSGTSYSRTGLGEGTYSLQVRALNKAGASAWSAASAAGSIVTPWNVTAMRVSCILNTADFMARNGCNNTAWVAAGTQLMTHCRGTSGGRWYLVIGFGIWTNHWILESDVQYAGGASVPVCPPPS